MMIEGRREEEKIVDWVWISFINIQTKLTTNICQKKKERKKRES